MIRHYLRNLELIRCLLAHAGGGSTADANCLDDTTATLFVARGLPAERAARVEAHIDGCSSCRRLVSALAGEV
jgi:hypothetical protein